MTLYDMLSYVIDGQEIELFDCETGETVYTGDTDDIPTEFEDRYVGSIEAKENRVILNLCDQGEKRTMNIEQLNEIISTMNLTRIKNNLESLGYRCASKHGKFEFDLMKILEQERTTATDDYEDTFDDHSYFAEVFENVKAFGGYDFIVVTQLNTKIDFPEHVDIYTNAPINEEYEKALEEVKKCKRCGKKFKAYELWEQDGKPYCKPCFQSEFSKKVRGK